MKYRQAKIKRAVISEFSGNWQVATDRADARQPLFDLWYGVAKSSRREFNKKRLEVFLAAPSIRFRSTMWTPNSPEQFELISGVGKPVGAYDLLIAGQAIRNKFTLITANLSEFARIKALAWADWGKP